MHSSPKEVIKHLRELVKKGLPIFAALQALTTTPAELFGVENVAGTLTKGRIANLVVMTGMLENRKSKVKYVFADGRQFDFDIKKQTEKPEIDVTGEWDLVLKTDDADMESVLELKQSGSEVTGTISNETIGELEIDDGTVAGKTFSFKVTIERGGNSFTVSFTGKMEDDKLTGTAKSPMGDGTWTATKPEK